jgi:cytochrome c553
MNLRLALLASGVAASLCLGSVQAAEPQQKADPAKGQQLAATCAACHGPDGNSAAPTFPKIAGQGAAYIAKQLHDFKSENGKPPARINPIMNGMAAPLSDQDILDLSAYFSSQKLKPEMAKNKSVLALGQKIYRAGIADKGVPACAGCHGPTGAGVPTEFPQLAGQFVDYTVAQMKLWRSGERANDENAVMRTVAANMSDAEIAAVAEYIAGLR